MGHQILHIERMNEAHSYRLTTETGAHLEQVTEWLWQGPPPQGPQLTYDDPHMDYNQFLLSGMTEEASFHLRPDAYTALAASEPENYRSYRERHDAEHERWNTPHWLLGLTPSQLYHDTSRWGPHEVNGHFVWVGQGTTHHEFQIQVMPYFQSEQLNRHMRWYLAQPGTSLSWALHEIEEFQGHVLAMTVLGFVAAGGPGA